MIEISTMDEWTRSPKEAASLQARLAEQVVEAPLGQPVRLIAGGDVAFLPGGNRLVAAWVVWDMQTGKVIETADDTRDVSFPYVPGLLSFREAPGLLATASKLRTRPDVYLLDGHGRAHPRRFGLASHVGLRLARPSIGCAKSRLCGSHREPGPRRGACTRLMDSGELVGRVLRTREGVKPIYVSVGHLVMLDEAVRIVLESSRGYRMPEPTRLAHHHVTRLRGEL